jgi:hypothetical protein
MVSDVKFRLAREAVSERLAKRRIRRRSLRLDHLNDNRAPRQSQVARR